MVDLLSCWSIINSLVLETLSANNRKATQPLSFTEVTSPTSFFKIKTIFKRIREVGMCTSCRNGFLKTICTRLLPRKLMRERRSRGLSKRKFQSPGGYNGSAGGGGGCINRNFVIGRQCVGRINYLLRAQRGIHRAIIQIMWTLTIHQHYGHFILHAFLIPILFLISFVTKFTDFDVFDPGGRHNPHLTRNVKHDLSFLLYL